MPADARDAVTLAVAGREHRDWESYSIDSDLFTPADAWQVSLGIPAGEVPATLHPWAEVELRLGTDTVLTGRIDVLRRRLARGAHSLTLHGRDRAAVLLSLPRVNEYCFPGRHDRGHIVNLKDPWQRILAAAGLSGWRIHDLRHAFASYAVNSGQTLPVIGKMLGHTQAATTARYAHLAENPVAAAAESTARAIQKDLSGGKVLPFRKLAG